MPPGAQIADHMRAQIQEQIRLEITQQVRAAVQDQMPDHLPVSLQEQADESKRQLIEVRHSLLNRCVLAFFMLFLLPFGLARDLLHFGPARCTMILRVLITSVFVVKHAGPMPRFAPQTWTTPWHQSSKPMAKSLHLPLRHYASCSRTTVRACSYSGLHYNILIGDGA